MGKNNKLCSAQGRASSAPVQIAAVCLISLLAFFVVCLCSAATVKGVAIAAILAVFAAACVRFKVLQERVRLPLIVLALIVLMDLLSTFYAVSGKFALNEFVKVITSFALVLLLLALVPGEGEKPGRSIAALLSRTTALMGLVSIDLISTRWISSLLLWFPGLFNPDFNELAGVEVGTRMLSLVGNPNVFAGAVGIGVLLSLSLVLSSKRGKERMGHIVCLFINALSFVLAFSMGAIGIIALAFVVYLILERKECRAGLFILMVETLVVTAVGVALVSMTSLQEWNAVQPIPMLCVIVGSAVLCLLDHVAGQRLADRMAEHGRMLLAVIGGLLVVLVIGVVAAYNLTGAAHLAAGEELRRSVYPEAGEYTVSAQVSGPVTVKIESQDREETMMHTSTVLYQGSLENASFTVPEDAKVVYFNFSAKQDVSLESVCFSGQNGEGEVPLDYKLLPGFIANRIQGLFANQNAIQRTVFIEDGLKLFRRSPVFGLGMGSYENGILDVQSFFYETKYAHNHYVQVLAETGVIGLLLFAGLLVVSAAAILRSRRREDMHPLTPALGAALVFMAGHAAVEVVFSSYSYLPVAFGTFGLINLCCADAHTLPNFGVKVRKGILGAIGAILLVFFVLLCGNLRAENMVEKTPTFDSLERAVKLDKYEWADYMLTYVVSAPNAADVPEVQMQAAEYASRLERVDSNTIPFYLAQFYFQSGNFERGIAMLEKYVGYVSSKTEAWQVAFDLLELFEVDADYFREGVAHIVQLMNDWNAENMGKIVLDQETQAFLARMGVQ